MVRSEHSHGGLCWTQQEPDSFDCLGNEFPVRVFGAASSVFHPLSHTPPENGKQEYKRKEHKVLPFRLPVAALHSLPDEHRNYTIKNRRNDKMEFSAFAVPSRPWPARRLSLSLPLSVWLRREPLCRRLRAMKFVQLQKCRCATKRPAQRERREKKNTHTEMEKEKCEWK